MSQKPRPDVVKWEPTPYLRFQSGTLHQMWECRTEKFFFMDHDGYSIECSSTEYTTEWRKVPSHEW